MCVVLVVRDQTQYNDSITSALRGVARAGFSVPRTSVDFAYINANRQREFVASLSPPPANPLPCNKEESARPVSLAVSPVLSNSSLTHILPSLPPSFPPYIPPSLLPYLPPLPGSLAPACHHPACTACMASFILWQRRRHAVATATNHLLVVSEVGGAERTGGRGGSGMRVWPLRGCSWAYIFGIQSVWVELYCSSWLLCGGR